MNPKTVIKGKIHYVGVNDRNKHLFEGMWPLPYGVSYNSYLIDDETVALVDTVDICYFEVYLRKIKSIIGERPIQYLIINHMEPDHSGSIRLIKQHYPDIIIVGNKQTFGMIEGFYGVTGEQYMVKDEDFLALGHHKLRFYMTPMVHWPETMMTFDETEGVLFAGDGFGCFGTLDGGFLDTRIKSGQILGRDGALLFQHRGQVRLSGAEGTCQAGRSAHFHHLLHARAGVDGKHSQGYRHLRQVEPLRR